jgi:hypothetical protein
MKFTKQEYIDLHLLYGESPGNSRPARRPYGERFPEGYLPFRCTFVELHLHLCEAGSDWFQYNGVLDLTAFDFLLFGPTRKIWCTKLT